MSPKRLRLFLLSACERDPRGVRCPTLISASCPPSVWTADWNGRSPARVGRPLLESQTMRGVSHLYGEGSIPGDFGPMLPGKTRLRRSSFPFGPLDKTVEARRHKDWADRSERRLGSRGRSRRGRETEETLNTLWRGFRSRRGSASGRAGDGQEPVSGSEPKGNRPAPLVRPPLESGTFPPR